MENNLDSKYPDKEKFKKLVTEYFEVYCLYEKRDDYLSEKRKQPLPYTIPGLAEHLVCFTEELLTYPKDGPLSKIIAFASQKCEVFLINGLVTGNISKSVGDVLLKLYFNTKKEDEEKPQSISDALNSLDQNQNA